VSWKLWLKAGLTLSFILSLTGRARADITLAKVGDGWEFYTSGRIGAFVQVLKGDGRPQAFDAMGTAIHPVGDGGIPVTFSTDPILVDGVVRPGPLFASRVRSGFLGNILSVGVRRQLSERTTLMGHLSIWGTAESDSRRTYLKNVPDEREGYIKVEGPAGSLLLGRALSLFSRGATEINFLYGHGFAVGNPAGFDEYGPSAGHIGFGVLGSVFAAGLVYATPKLAGLQLTVGYYDPATFVGLYWTRAKFGRPEAELTFDAAFGSNARLHLFVNGAWQKLYATDLPRNTDIYGAGAGGRIEVGPVHLGVAGHTGKGLGVYYALNGSDAVLAQFTTQELRKFDGAYVQSQFIVGPVDLNFGVGITRVHPLAIDYVADPATMQVPRSFLKFQRGASAVAVYHMTSTFHLAADYFLSDILWQQGETQTVHSFNLGGTITW
jgi:hypothetical protein